MASFGSFKDISSINKNNLIEHAKNNKRLNSSSRSSSSSSSRSRRRS
jgi:hypothetical protein